MNNALNTEANTEATAGMNTDANNPLHLADYLAADIALEPTRKGFGRGLVAAGQRDARVVAACADLTESVQFAPFREAFPERFVQVGIAEQNLVALGSGLAAAGKIPFVGSYAAFNPGRNWEQIKTTVCLNDQPVKIVGGHAGLYTGPDGATHQMLEDIALMRVLPNMVVVVPADAIEAEKATLALAADARPSYLRLTREATPIMTTADTPFQIGRAYVFVSGVDVTIIATGPMTYFALQAADKLRHDGVAAEVIHAPTVKPLDCETILASVTKTGCVVTVEEAQIAGGLGGAVAEFLSETVPSPMRRIGMRDCFGESGKPAELFEHFGITPEAIMVAAREVIAMKGMTAMKDMKVINQGKP